MTRFAAAIAMVGALSSSVWAADAEIHYAPIENLERIDVDLIGTARKSIDFAAYSLTEWAVISALVEARRRNVTVRIALDPSQRHALTKLGDLGDAIRLKRPGPYMHLKSYAIDHETLRAGSANFSPSGLKAQDNELVILRTPEAAGKFEMRFAAIWNAAVPIAETNRRVGTALALATPTTGADGPQKCAIKGNVNRKGDHIYHLAGDRSYELVTMNDSRKQWFCSEEEALAAGFRHAGWGGR